MATPVTGARFWGDLKDHVSTEPHGDWTHHNRGTRGDGWGPVHGVAVHHFGPYASLAGAIELSRTGRADLPGPLYQVLVDTKGVCHLIGWGRVNHAGGGDPDVLRHLVAEQLPFPAPRYEDGQDGAVDGNARLYGICLLNRGNGTQKYPEQQLDAAAWAAALLCHYHGWSQRSVIAHKEWQRGKIDPTTPMDPFRARVGRLLAKLS
ncbi:N-acetylmuramoyl-L-alanine amidase [Streptomyces sp. NPDC056653]|uniref:peptidoglycan recognition protein family protein n=1 Tax=Streptomyces sp. NPDC056653 TaxID=3345894 RepID=UPI003678D824